MPANDGIGDTSNIDYVKFATLLKYVEDSPSINSCTYYIPGAFIFFPFHEIAEQLLSIPYLGSGASNK